MPSNPKPSYIFVGYKPTTIDTIDEYLEQPPVPGQYKKPDSIAEWEKTIRPGLYLDLCYKAAFEKLTGRIDQVYAVDKTRKGRAGIFVSGQDSTENVSVKFLKWLRQGNHDLRTVCLVGFTVRRFAGVNGIEAILSGESVPAKYWSRGFGDVPMIDPYEMLVSEEARRKVLPVQAVLRLFKIDYPADWQPNFTSPMEDVRLSVELAFRIGVFDETDPQKVFDFTQVATPNIIEAPVE